MDLWPKNQELLPQYTRFDTVRGRIYTYDHHGRHQATHYNPANHEEQWNHARESSYWTLPRSKTRGTLLDHTNWTESRVCASTSAQHCFSGALRSQQNMGDDGSRDAREWTTAGQVVGVHERDHMREGWQRRWEPANLVRYRESSKRDSSSYRELEAWAARYSHSLPRRRRIEAELRGASHGLLENRRTGIESCMAAPQQIGQCANTRDDPGQWERAVKQQIYSPPQAPDASHVMDMKGRIQRRMFGQPPGYIAPPPYNSPHKGSLVVPQHWDRVEKTQEKPDRKQTTSPEFEGHASQGNPALHNVNIPQKVLTCPQISKEVKTTTLIQESSSKVIEGRKFRLSKKTGGMTIFCLVSRIAGPTEHASSTPCEQANTPNKEPEKCSPSSSGTIQTSKVADEVDYKALAQMSVLTFENRDLKSRKMTQSCLNPGLPQEVLPKPDKTEGCPFNENINDTERAVERRATPSVSPASAKYPLWREPSFTRRTLSRSPLGMEVRRLDIKQRPETEEGQDLLVIDTTCVVVKMELIKSPKKEHVHFLGSKTKTEQSPEHRPPSSNQSCSLLSSDLHSDELNFQRPKNSLNPDLAETTTLECESENTARESLEKRAERILGIHLHATSSPDIPVTDADKGSDSLEVNKDETTAKEEQSQNQQDTSRERRSVAEDTDASVDCDNFSGSQQQVSNVLQENGTNSQSETDNMDQVDMMEVPPGGSTPEAATPEQSDMNNDVTQSPGLFNPLLLAKDAQESHLNLESSLLAMQSLPCFSESEIEEAPDADSAMPDPIVDCTLQPGTISLLNVPTLIPFADPSTLPSDVITSTAMPDIEVCEEAEKGQSSQHGELSNVLQESPDEGTNELVAHHQVGSSTANKDAIDIALELLDLNPGIFQEKPEEFNTDQLICIPTEEENKTDGPDEDSENVTPSESKEEEGKFFDFQAVDDVKVKETNTKAAEDNKDLTGVEEQTAECQCDISPSIKSSPLLPSTTNHEAQPQSSPPPQESSEEFALHSGTESACPSPQNHDSAVGLPETLSDLLLDYTPSPDNSAPLSPATPPPPPPPPEESGSDALDMPEGAEFQFPNSLWDAVNRIRKHTAPDSENEEEETLEFWDPESVGVDFEQGVFEELRVFEGNEVAQMLPRPWREDDTLSCSSASSHDSGDTVIIADEDEMDETEEEGGRCHLVEKEQNIAGGQEGEGDGDERTCDQGEEYQTAVEDGTTKDEEIV
ncbi:uncharacterized protein LOC109522171 [Hippocampus comes]|uniref:uncharacterized protein LOC109522171 n=1 Tax=Hippocampus comes TaxID=109280 RepID=UPI00094EB725|nr:PREDICTED: uncharacterized protein LOC109522171 [Hippocampus comes]